MKYAGNSAGTSYLVLIIINLGLVVTHQTHTLMVSEFVNLF